MKISSKRRTFSILLRVQVLRLNGLTLAALGQAQASNTSNTSKSSGKATAH